MLYGIVVAITALLLSALLAAALRGPALRLGAVDRRRQRAVPLSGGIAVLLVTALVAGVGDWAGFAPLGTGVGRLLVAGVWVGALGLLVDHFRLRWWVPLAGTAPAALAVVPYTETGPWAGLLAVAWIVCVTVAFRGLDHADGLAGSVAVVTAFGVAACAAVELMDGVAVLLSVLAAALTGFLMHNWHPARVALGAGGALFTGFLLASAAVFVRAGQSPGASAWVLFALTAVVCADAVLVVLSRCLARRPLPRGRPDHLVHRLRRLGLAPRAATVLLGAGALAGVTVAVLAHAGHASQGGVRWVAAVTVVVVLALVRVPVSPAAPETARTAVRTHAGTVPPRATAAAATAMATATAAATARAPAGAAGRAVKGGRGRTVAGAASGAVTAAGPVKAAGPAKGAGVLKGAGPAEGTGAVKGAGPRGRSAAGRHGRPGQPGSPPVTATAPRPRAVGPVADPPRGRLRRAPGVPRSRSSEEPPARARRLARHLHFRSP
ncbi:undecaprenyl/decaprenyl-phosphate alpha-N-acetylglucosaminyl 1-phosphate transferase [Streptomyces sp. SBST2-5]|uniref:Undecaprenyl/decaprenyl-phosphate alpha-N-acetylglucosaminyl 1-phosphate transferase n=1 Tax=Streptomyces composti TaxID=2720025 RepID=A0ABX1A589_9ACTN|nr:undecaprenyl/decaprenyl-phosphate alpha-N-acetylglucosaminyl 1-phosphate transferase [Streptomyces composti]